MAGLGSGPAWERVKVLKAPQNSREVKSRLTGEGPQEPLRGELFWCFKVGPEHVRLCLPCKLFPSAVLACECLRGLC